MNNLSSQNTYDAAGNVTKTKLTSGTQSITNEFTYNATNDLLTHKDGKGALTQYTYDANGNVLQIQRFKMYLKTPIVVPAYALMQ